MVDCERSTMDEETIEARRNELPEDWSLEYLVHGEFKMTEHSTRSYPDSYWFSIDEMHQSGQSKAALVEATSNFEGALKDASNDALAGLPEDAE
jgi:hypothetical protein